MTFEERAKEAAKKERDSQALARHELDQQCEKFIDTQKNEATKKPLIM